MTTVAVAARATGGVPPGMARKDSAKNPATSTGRRGERSWRHDDMAKPRRSRPYGRLKSMPPTEAEETATPVELLLLLVVPEVE